MTFIIKIAAAVTNGIWAGIHPYRNITFFKNKVPMLAVRMSNAFNACNESLCSEIGEKINN